MGYKWYLGLYQSSHFSISAWIVLQNYWLWHDRMISPILHYGGVEEEADEERWGEVRGDSVFL